MLTLYETEVSGHFFGKAAGLLLSEYLLSEKKVFRKLKPELHPDMFQDTPKFNDPPLLSWNVVKVVNYDPQCLLNAWTFVAMGLKRHAGARAITRTIGAST